MPLYPIASPDPDDVVTLDEVKRHLRVDHADEDALIRGYINAAIANLDGRDGWLAPRARRADVGAPPAGVPSNGMHLGAAAAADRR